MAFIGSTTPSCGGSVQREAVSVIIPTYNRARVIARAITSALAAVSDGDEIIVVDDGSTDDTQEVLKAFGDRVRIIRAPNGGAGAARNVGIRHATRPLVAFLDSDDEWSVDKLALQRPFMAARPDILFCFSDFAMLHDETGERESMYLKNWHQVDRPWEELLGPGVRYSSIAPLPSGREDFHVHEGDLYPALLEGPFVAAWTSLIRREAAGDALHFQEGVKICEDWWCYAQLARIGKAAYFACETAVNHGHSGERVTDANEWEFSSCRLQMTEEIWGEDEVFRRSHGSLYSRTLAAIHRQRARWLLGRGHTRQARSELERTGGSLGLKLVAALPEWVALPLASLRRLLIGALFSGMAVMPEGTLAMLDMTDVAGTML
jgi:GT2 family glycosyltransferase